MGREFKREVRMLSDGERMRVLMLLWSQGGLAGVCSVPWKTNHALREVGALELELGHSSMAEKVSVAEGQKSSLLLVHVCSLSGSLGRKECKSELGTLAV